MTLSDNDKALLQLAPTFGEPDVEAILKMTLTKAFTLADAMQAANDAGLEVDEAEVLALLLRLQHATCVVQLKEGVWDFL